uniref:Uncharacterized protein n=1 Tax=Lepeophtheirus salmonis TaxID=72036 RepID=A0A0K2TTL8_LEPSM
MDHYIQAYQELQFCNPHYVLCTNIVTVLPLSDRSVRKILNDDLHCHPYKTAFAQELSNVITLHE